MSTTSLIAAEVMNRSAALMNDPARTDYTYVAQLPYLNMAIDELVELLEESNSSPSNQTSAVIVVPIGVNQITPTEHPATPHYPFDLIEIQGLLERAAGTSEQFVTMTRKEFMGATPINNNLAVWRWEDQIIKFNSVGASTPREVQIQYVRQPLQQAVDENTIIGVINARSFLSFKTAAFCAMFIGENETRAQVLEGQAEKAYERMTGIDNKGRQQMVTRHRPFRAGYKSRGSF